MGGGVEQPLTLGKLALEVLEPNRDSGSLYTFNPLCFVTWTLGVRLGN